MTCHNDMYLESATAVVPRLTFKVGGGGHGGELIVGDTAALCKHFPVITKLASKPSVSPSWISDCQSASSLAEHFFYVC